MATTIKTNHQWRDLLHWHELTDGERARFDWLDTEDRHGEASFVRYRGWCYCLDEFMRSEALPGYHGYAGDSYFSGVAIKLSSDGDRVQLATVYS
jgi:hypothetical protein